ncbi:hypothetical protein N7468_007212 [Penicillium chermesinum]|uniref:CST complex subunit Stn1 N-terminal domain-containing protein n=1 Tax=Penicillium chermesinum TaxID=63820 RepID=A0A9W9NTM4_9EURO|nr:uncharacterized protein N7468_007212 [Penicillium chermesinum]KAJ5225987.1 hypothetical protein N7468_007212 [Penicillium chermesinum]
MATVGNAHLEYYPAFCFKASPTHFSWVKMSAADVHRLHQPIGFKGRSNCLPFPFPLCFLCVLHTGGQKVYFYKNYPIRFVTVVGVILQREEKARRTILLLDDSSGATLEIVALYSPERTQPLTAQNLEPADHPIAEALDSSRTMHITATDKKALDISALVPGTVAKIKGTLSQFRDTMQVVVEKFSLIKETNDEMRFLDERLRFLVGVLCEPWVLSEEEIELLEREAEREVSRAGDERRRAMERMKRRAEREEKDMRRIMRRYESDERARERGGGCLSREWGAAYG